jgi:Coenzyme PQQ synthesis protein D (PqqD)
MAKNNAHYTLLPHVRWIVNADGAVLLDTNSGSMFSLNATGGLMWKCLTEGYATEDIALYIASECGVQTEEVAVDLDMFLAELQARGLLNPVQAQAESRRV